MGKESPAVYSTFVINLINWLLGRKFITNMRYAQYISPRSEAPPNLPPGPHSRLSHNYYFERDPRRSVDPPQLAFFGHTTYSLPSLDSTLPIKHLEESQILLPDKFLEQLEKEIKNQSLEKITPTLGQK